MGKWPHPLRLPGRCPRMGRGAMSNQALTWALEVRAGGPGPKGVLMVLANYANADDDSYPGIDRIAHESEQSPATVKRNIEKLIDKRLISRHARGAQDGGRLSNRYHLNRGVSAQSELFGFQLNSGGVLAHLDGGFSSPVSQEPIEPKNLSKESLDRFEEWYRIYPRHSAKADAVKAWKKATKKTDPDLIIGATRLFVGRCKNADPKFIPYPATWLNREQWTDETEPDAQPVERRAPWTPAPPPPEIADDPVASDQWYRDQLRTRPA